MNLPPGVRQHDRINEEWKDLSRDLEEGLAFHFKEMIRALEPEGMSREQARLEARRRFGNGNRYRRRIGLIDRMGDMVSGMAMVLESFRDHPRLAFRRLRLAPVLAAGQ
jgi:hypothetical protein